MRTVLAISSVTMPRKRAGSAGPRKGATRPVDPPPFGRSPAMLLLLAREAVMQRWRPFLHARQLTDQQWRVVRALREVESLEIIELGKRCCIHPASLSRIVPKLAADGIVSRYHNQTDQRRVVVSLTPRGRDMVEDAIGEGAHVYEQLSREVGAERLENACRVLEELIEHLAVSARKAKPEQTPDTDLDC